MLRTASTATLNYDKEGYRMPDNMQKLFSENYIRNHIDSDFYTTTAIGSNLHLKG